MKTGGKVFNPTRRGLGISSAEASRLRWWHRYINRDGCPDDIKRQVDVGWRRFWAARGVDVDAGKVGVY